MVKIDTLHGTILHTNNYIISKDDKIVLIESSANVEKVKELVGDKKVEAILLTHGHWDHFLHIDKYINAFGDKVYMSKNSINKLNKKDRSFAADKKLDLKISDKNITFIKDGDILNFGKGLNFEVLETKGHTDCSVSYLLNNECLFSGDTLFKDGIGRCDLPTGSHKELEKSLRKLSRLDLKIVVYPGHGEKTTIGKEYCTL